MEKEYKGAGWFFLIVVLAVGALIWFIISCINQFGPHRMSILPSGITLVIMVTLLIIADKRFIKT